MPKWRNFAKSGHTDTYLPRAQKIMENELEFLIDDLHSRIKLGD